MPEWVKEVHEGSATVNKDGTVTTTRVFRYFSGNAASRPAWSIAGIGINKYAPHPDDPRLLATDVTTVPVSGELGWFTVTYTYQNLKFDSGATETTGGSGGSGPGGNDPVVNPDPTTRTPTVKWGSVTRTVPFTVDFDDPIKDVQNSAGQPYEGQEVEVTNTLLTLSFNIAGQVDIATKQQTYQNRVNDDFFSPVPAHGPYGEGELRCNSWEGSLQYEADYGWYTAAEVTFEWKVDGWERHLLDQGYYRRFNDGVGGYRTERIISPQTGMAPDAPVKLNGGGDVLNPGDTVFVAHPYFVIGNGTPDVSVYKIFYPYQWVDFTNIFS